MGDDKKEVLKVWGQIVVSVGAFGFGAFLIICCRQNPEYLGLGSGMCGAVLGYWLR